MEFRKPKNLKRLRVFADTETWYYTNGVKPWEIIGKKDCEAKLVYMDVNPLLIVWQRKRFRYRADKGSYVEAAGHENKVYVVDDNFNGIVDLMNELSFIFNELRLLPVLTFHNSTYDIPVISPLLRALDPNLELYFYTNPDSKHFLRGGMQSPKYHFDCEFGDTMKYDKTMSIERAGKILGQEKIKGFPYGMCDIEVLEGGMVSYIDMHTGEKRECDLEFMIQYASTDVDIMRKMHERQERIIEDTNRYMLKDWDEMDKGYFLRGCQTRPNHSKTICNKHLEMNGGKKIDDAFRFNIAEHYEPSVVESLYQTTIESNCGGLTTPNKSIFKYHCPPTHHIKYFDRNSMYPAIMTGSLPYGTILDKRPPGLHTVGHQIKIHECEWKNELRCLKKQAFSVDKLNGVPFFIEGEYWKFVLANCNVKYEIEKTCYQQNTDVLRSLVNKYYDDRRHIKAQMKNLDKRSPEYENLNDRQDSLKVLMNSLYGKLCEKGHHMSMVYHENKYREFTNEDPVYPCILTGAFITYRAQLCLLQKIKLVIENGCDFLYADTDSVIFGCSKSFDPETIFGRDTGALGEGKEEGTFTLYLTNGKKKKYCLFNEDTGDFKMAMSGITRRIQAAIKNTINLDFHRGIKYMEMFFSPEENIQIMNCKPTTVLNKRAHQHIIYNAHFQMNSSLKRITGIMNINEELNTVTIERCRPK